MPPRLVDTDLDSDTFEAVLKKLVDAVSHHIEEEESDVLPALDELPKKAQETLAAQPSCGCARNTSWPERRR